MNDPDDIDMLAAEYVLGTLEQGARLDVEQRLANEPALAAAIARWSKHLAPLNAYIEEAVPGDAVRDAVRAKIQALSKNSADYSESQKTEAVGGEVVRLKRHVGRWRTAALAAMAAAAAFAGLFLFGAHLNPFAVGRSFVAIFNDGDKQPAFVMSIDLDTRELTIRPINAGRLTGKAYELWIVSDDIALRSLGLLDSAEKPTRKRLEGFDRQALQQATFGISVEPEGGSPVGRPTGPAIHGKLIPTTN